MEYYHILFGLFCICMGLENMFLYSAKVQTLLICALLHYITTSRLAIYYAGTGVIIKIPKFEKHGLAEYWYMY